MIALNDNLNRRDKYRTGQVKSELTAHRSFYNETTQQHLFSNGLLKQNLEIGLEKHGYQDPEQIVKSKFEISRSGKMVGASIQYTEKQLQEMIKNRDKKRSRESTL